MLNSVSSVRWYILVALVVVGTSYTSWKYVNRAYTLLCDIGQLAMGTTTMQLMFLAIYIIILYA